VNAVLRFGVLKRLSFLHSAIYLGLLTFWAIPGQQGVQPYFGWGHGVGWIGMSLLCLAALHRRVIPLWLAVTVIVVGGVGPFAGSLGFIVHERRSAARARGMVRRES
jgi:hypothetical protein